MKLQRFWIAGKISAEHSFGGLFEVADTALLHQLKNVFRFKIGNAIVVFDGDGQDHECLIREFLKDKVIFELRKSYPSRFMSVLDIWLFASVIKKDKFEWIAEKATELGVSHIVPILSDRSEKKSLNMERLKKIVIEASEQSGRGNIPTVHPIIKIDESLEYLKSQVSSDKLQVLAFHTEGMPAHAGELFQGDTLDKEKSTAVFIGPEGGWSEREVEWFHKENVQMKSLGKQVLRAETAAIAAMVKVIL